MTKFYFTRGKSRIIQRQKNAFLFTNKRAVNIYCTIKLSTRMPPYCMQLNQRPAANCRNTGSDCNITGRQHILLQLVISCVNLPTQLFQDVA